MGIFKRLKEKFGSSEEKNSEDKKLEEKKSKKVIKKKVDYKEKVKKEGIFKRKEKSKDEVLEALKEKNKKNSISIYEKGLKKSRNLFSRKIEEIIEKKRNIDEELLEEIEEVLISSDVGASLSIKLVDKLRKEIVEKNITEAALINEILFDLIFETYVGSSLVSTKLNIIDGRLNIIIVSGVNGSGKTTSIAKIAKKFRDEDKKVIVAAADTFRAGAVKQLEEWTKRIGIDIVKPFKDKQDPSSVVFEALQKAKNEKYDILICDTAGRLQNKQNLMNELNKMYKVLKSEIPDAPHESLLVIDATTGQNGINQALKFNEVAKIDGIILSKMDGTSKGGIILAIKELLDIPVKFIGLGEKMDDLQEFDLDEYLYALTKNFIDKV